MKTGNIASMCMITTIIMGVEILASEANLPIDSLDYQGIRKRSGQIFKPVITDFKQLRKVIVVSMGTHKYRKALEKATLKGFTRNYLTAALKAHEKLSARDKDCPAKLIKILTDAFRREIILANKKREKNEH